MSSNRGVVYVEQGKVEVRSIESQAAQPQRPHRQPRLHPEGVAIERKQLQRKVGDMESKFRKMVIRFAATLSVAALCASTALGQSRTELKIYGVVDAGIEVSDSGTADPSRLTKVSTGNLSANRLGFIGSEDLGGGYNAHFNLEMGFNLDVGDVVTFGTPGTLFGRRSVVGLETPFGTFDFGRDYTPGFWAVQLTDRFRYGLPGNVSAASQINESRTNNGIFYKSPSFDGFYSRLSYGLGQERTNAPRDLGRFWSASLEYRGGPLYAIAVYQERKDLLPGSTTASGKLSEGGGGITYDFKPFSVNAGYFTTKPLSGPVDSIAKTEAYWVGGAYDLTSVSVVYAQVGKTNFDFVGPRGSGNALTYGIGYNYLMSKRTTLYAGYGGVNNDNARLRLSTGSASVGGVVFGASPKALVAGMRHTF